MVIRYEFKPVKEAAYAAVQEARELWIAEARTTARQKLESGAATHGYALSASVEGERIGFQSARIYTVAHSSKWGDDPWWLKFFEYGAVQIQAMPFMRPAARKANKAFVARLGSDLEGKIRKARMKKHRGSRRG